MIGLPLRARGFLWIVVGGAAALTVWSIPGERASIAAALGLTSARDVAITLLGMAAIIAAGLYPICLGNKVRVSIGGAIIFATALLMPPLRTIAMVIPSVALYTTLNARKERWPVYYPVFNIAQLSLTAGVTSLLFHRLDMGTGLQLASLAGMGHLAAAVASYFLLNSGQVATMSALVQGRSAWALWRAMNRRMWPRSLALLVLGIAIAALYLLAPAAVLLLAVPLYVIHQAYSHAMKVETQARHTLEALADVIDKRDPYTFAHSQRVAEYARRTAHRLGLPEEAQEAVALAARVHDVGKIGVADALLKSPARLSPGELEEIRRHTLIGAEIVSRLEDYAQSQEAILYHHERWDGSGAHRLARESIPMGARIIAVADAYDAMTSDRPYRQALSREAAWAELERARGTQFDPVVVEALIEVVQSLEPGVLPGAPAGIGVAPSPRPAQVQH